jgi:hypothetical protein
LLSEAKSLKTTQRGRSGSSPLKSNGSPLLFCAQAQFLHPAAQRAASQAALRPLIWVRHGGVIPPLQPLYNGPYAELCCGPYFLTIQIGSRGEIIAVSHLKARTAADAKPGSPRCHGRALGPRPGGPATAKPVSFSDPLISTPSPLAFGASLRLSRNRFPTWRGGFSTSGTSGIFTVSTEAVPITSKGTAKEVRPLTSSPSSQGHSSGGALWRPVYTPG